MLDVVLLLAKTSLTQSPRFDSQVHHPLIFSAPHRLMLPWAQAKEDRIAAKSTYLVPCHLLDVQFRYLPYWSRPPDCSMAMIQFASPPAPMQGRNSEGEGRLVRRLSLERIQPVPLPAVVFLPFLRTLLAWFVVVRVLGVERYRGLARRG